MRSRHCLVPHFINTTTFVASIFGSGEARRGSIPRSGAVTEEQRSQNRKATQPSGRRFFLTQTSLLTPYRPLKGMLVARASSGPKIPRRKRGRIYGTGYLGYDCRLQSFQSGAARAHCEAGFHGVVYPGRFQVITYLIMANSRTKLPRSFF